MSATWLSTFTAVNRVVMDIYSINVRMLKIATTEAATFSIGH